MKKNAEGHYMVNDLIDNENKKQVPLISPIKKPRKAKSKADSRKLVKKLVDLPPYLLQGQFVACKCEICTKQLKMIRAEGLDDRIKDIIE